MKLCIDCAWYGGVALANGKFVCSEPRNVFVHPVDGLDLSYDAGWLRMGSQLPQFCGLDAKWWKEKDDERSR